ncbi:hypothetical protein P261_01261 [Lachnospiraceae bacterium TWA4]|nr:hypothetical protein P261_01261 [Lachnospiraceae bacterium TWA4]
MDHKQQKDEYLKKRRQEKIRRKNKRNNRYTIIFASIITVVLCSFFIIRTNQINKDIEVKKAQYESLQQEKEQAAKKKLELEKKLNYVLSDEYIESVAEEKLGLLKENEILLKPKSSRN